MRFIITRFVSHSLGLLSRQIRNCLSIDNILILHQRLYWWCGLLDRLLADILEEIVDILLVAREHLVYRIAGRTRNLNRFWLFNNRRVVLLHQILDDWLIRRNNDIFIAFVIHHVSMHHIIILLVNNWLNNILMLLSLHTLELFERLLRKYYTGLRYNGQARILQFLNRIVLHSFHLSYLFFH